MKREIEMSEDELVVAIENVAVWSHEETVEFMAKNQEAADALAAEKGIRNCEAMLRLVIAAMDC